MRGKSSGQGSLWDSIAMRGLSSKLPVQQTLRQRVQLLKNSQISRLRREHLAGYGYALLGVAAASLVIALIGQIAHISNISLLYLLVVLWLAAWFGRGPAILASVLSFLTYDFLFIPPLYRLTVNDPTAWFSLIALLITSLVTGQLAATVRDRAREAQQNQQRTATLYRLAQVIAAATDQDSLLAELARRLLDVFEPLGMNGVAIVLPGKGTTLTPQAVVADSGAEAEQNALRLANQTYAAEAAWALEHSAIVGDRVAGDSSGTRGNEANTDGGYDTERLIYFVPLTSGNRAVGLLAITGKSGIRGLLSPTRATQTGGSPQGALFAACCDQIALAIDRDALQRQAIHAEALYESNQLKDVFLGSVTHDLRTPLASVKAAVTSLLGNEGSWSSDQRHELLEAIDQSADRLNRLVGNLVAISRQEAGVAAPEKDWYLIADVIATVLNRLDLAGQLHGRDIQIDVAEDVPLVPMDHAQLEQVLTNLLENALKYSPSDRPIRITATTIEAPARELEVRVIDQGIGVPASELRAIFDKFYRVQHIELPWVTDRPPTGTGLGLAISENIIRAHGGRIGAESVPGEGSTFLFTLPIPADTPHGALPELVSPPKTDTPIAGETIHAEG